MKKKIKKAGTTNVANSISATVGEFMDILKDFPTDSKIKLNGSIDIKLDDAKETMETRISNINGNETDDLFINLSEDEEVITDECCNNVNCLVMDDYLFGIAKKCPEFTHSIRTASSDEIINAPIMTPNSNELLYEDKQLIVNQAKSIDEIRRHNVYVAEYMGEMHRREIAALLEYNTQCLAHFGVETNKVMCTVVDLIDDED